MHRKNPLDELGALLRERRRKRIKFLAKFHTRISRAAHHKLFDYETKAVEKEITLLEIIEPEGTLEWKNRLAEIKEKFENALLHIREVAQKAEKEDAESAGDDIYNRSSPNKPVEQTQLDIADTLLEIWGAASRLEKLTKEVEKKAVRTIRERRAAL